MPGTYIMLPVECESELEPGLGPACSKIKINNPEGEGEGAKNKKKITKKHLTSQEK